MLKLGMSLFAGSLLFATACDDGAIDKSDQAVKCANICKRVDDCSPGDDDTTECRMECVDRSSNDDFQEKADNCYDCLDDDKSCAENVLSCASECATVVTLSQAN